MAVSIGRSITDYKKPKLSIQKNSAGGIIHLKFLTELNLFVFDSKPIKLFQNKLVNEKERIKLSRLPF